MKKIGLFGFGTVGQGFYETLRRNPDTGAVISKVCIRELTRERSAHELVFTTDPNEILDDPEIDIVVELIDDAVAAKAIVHEALQRGKAVISANKKMIGESLEEVDQWHRQYEGPFLYEAAVGGGIPIIHNINASFRDQEIRTIKGILNGSSNYIFLLKCTVRAGPLNER